MPDSLVLEWVSGWMPQRPAHRIRVTRDGDVLLQRPDSVHTSRKTIDPTTARDLLERAEALRLEGLPERLMGREPYCRVVRNDHPWITLTLHGADTMERVEDCLLCSPALRPPPSSWLRPLASGLGGRIHRNAQTLTGEEDKPVGEEEEPVESRTSRIPEASPP